MIKINVVAVGKVKEKYFFEGIEEYKKRLQKFCDFSITEVKEENYTKVDDSIIEIIKQKEGERLAPYLKGNVYVTAIEGKKDKSRDFARLIESSALNSGVITFVIGGSYGVSDSIKQKATGLISFSDMTFPHTLFRLILTEQIYRAFTIINGIAYHK